MNAMNRILRTATVLGVAGVFSLSMAVKDSQAGFGIRVDFGNDGTFESTCQDGAACDLAPGITGLIITTDSDGNMLTVNTSSSKPLIGTGIFPHLDLANATFTTTGADVVRIQLSDTDFNGGPLTAMHFFDDIGGTITPDSGGTITSNLYRDLSNAQFSTGAGTFLCTTGPLVRGQNSSGNAFSGNCDATATVDNQFSITLEKIISHTGIGETSFNNNATATPEPTSMLLLGFGLVGLGTWKRRRSAKQD